MSISAYGYAHAIRLSLKATQQEIADFLDCTRGNVSLYDRGDRSP